MRSPRERRRYSGATGREASACGRARPSGSPSRRASRAGSRTLWARRTTSRTTRCARSPATSAIASRWALTPCPITGEAPASSCGARTLPLPSRTWRTPSPSRAARGAALVVVDPRSSTISRGATIHAGVRPGTDGALAWALVHELIAAGAYDKALSFGAPWGSRRRPSTRGRSPRGEPRRRPACPPRSCGRSLRFWPISPRAWPSARATVSTTIATASIRYGPSRCSTACWVRLASRAGHVRQGCLPCAAWRSTRIIPLDHLSPLGADRFPVLYSERHECHTMTAMDAMLEGRPYPLRALLVTAANPALTNPNSDRVRARSALWTCSSSAISS